MLYLFFFDTLLFDSFTVQRHLSQKKQIRSYLEKAVVREEGHLPVKEMYHKISLYFAGDGLFKVGPDLFFLRGGARQWKEC